MITDSIYKSFVLPGYSLAIEKADEERVARQKAEQQVQTEQYARREAEKEIARLMALLAQKNSQ
jgi:hypothetical protein